MSEIFVYPKTIYVLDEENDSLYPHGFTNESEAKEISECIGARVLEYIRKEAAEMAVSELQNENAELKAQVEQMEEQITALAINAEQQLGEEAKRYVCLSNSYVSGELTEIPEGSILNEKFYVETRILDIKDPLFGSLKERIDAHDLEIKAQAFEELANTLSSEKGMSIMVGANELRENANQLRQGEQTK